MERVVVTGASGKAGRAVVRDLLEHGYDVLGVDVLPPREGAPACPFLRADLTNLGEASEALSGADAVVHLANIPAPGLYAPSRTLDENVRMNHNVFTAATSLESRRVVWASSETTLGLPFDTPPRYAPVDEAHFPLPESAYALSKVLAEEAAAHFARWSGIPFIGLRLSNIMEPHDYERFPGFQDDPHKRKWNLWGYVDARDVALSCRLALTADVQGSENVIITAADTVMNTPSRDLMAAVFPGVEVREPLGEFETLLSIRKARETIGYQPEHSWRQEV
ncbi:MAG TPA: NAD(P)-dependent oxidoreductase [Deinococcales bacterium]|nr:NAD(P)-dependent oxidoreductase [Deinococcales bacterium]